MILNIDFTEEQLRGIAAARNKYNLDLQESSTDNKDTDEAYLTFVLLSAADSYASHYPA
jgi:hypothetical protein